MISIQTKLEEKNMDDVFWLYADRKSFKPINKLNIKNNKETKSIVHKKEDIIKYLLQRRHF
jgi:hypothetical protein